MAYLLDTNWLIQLLAGHKETATFHKSIHPDKLAVSDLAPVWWSHERVG